MARLRDWKVGAGETAGRAHDKRLAAGTGWRYPCRRNNRNALPPPDCPCLPTRRPPTLQLALWRLSKSAIRKLKLEKRVVTENS